MLSTQSLLMVQLAFELRQDVIAERLCVNRDVPTSTCEGRCFLKKRLAETQRQQEEHAAGLEVLFAFHLLLPSTAGVPAPPAQVRLFPSTPVRFGAAGSLSDVFRPPRLG